MSVMSELYLDIEDQLLERVKPAQIAENLGIPISMVYEVQEELMLFPRVEVDYA